MLLIIFIFFVKIDLLSCIFENKNEEEDLFNEINRQRTNLGISNLKIHIILQLAAEKRCANQKQLIESYEKMLLNTYKNDEWPKQEQLHQIFPNIGEIISLNGKNIRNDIFLNSFLISNIYQKNFLYIGISVYEYKNFSAKCILYGSLNNNSISNYHQFLRLLYILIGCGIFLLSLIICSIINDRRQIKLKQQLEKNIFNNKKSMNLFIDNDRKLSSQQANINRMTMTHLNSIIDERPSAVHSFVQNSK